jgi:hypothetical protein
MQLDERRAQTRIKIQLGGLVIKAGLEAAPKALILGILLDGLQRSSDPEVRARLSALGHLALQVGTDP